MMSTVILFKSCLADTIARTSLDQSHWRAEEWKVLWDKVNQEVLNDAFSQHGVILEIFSSLGKLEYRRCKSLARVHQKMNLQWLIEQDYFKVLSDFIAVRLHCPVGEIPSKIDQIREIVKANVGKIYVKGATEECPYGLCKNSKGEYTDITQKAHIFIERIGYVIEFQINHEFASHAFTLHSTLREKKTSEKVDLISQGFYSEVRKYILDKTNDRNPDSKEELLGKAKQIHNGCIPADLQKILICL